MREEEDSVFTSMMLRQQNQSQLMDNFSLMLSFECQDADHIIIAAVYIQPYAKNFRYATLRSVIIYSMPKNQLYSSSLDLNKEDMMSEIGHCNTFRKGF